ncbi:hypothetical protein [Desertivirga xinjiangensis]|uniref:hypothetical protein n=1 Tax=Desertivirga xinjiangensis TaxID=539206 RepID=UPI0021097731|nr:hypothetical protein [Pedobacter xinjiangensis]
MNDIQSQIEQLSQLISVTSNRKLLNRALVEEFVACGYARSGNGFSSITREGEKALNNLKVLFSFKHPNTFS